MQRLLSPDSLQAARLARSMSLALLSQASGISTPNLSRIENGTRPTSDDEVASLAKALDIPEAALRRPLVAGGLGLSAFYHRKLSTAGVRAVASIENQCILDVVALKQLAGMVTVPQTREMPRISPDEIKNGDVEEAANMVRLMWQVPRGPIRDLCSLIESTGCFIVHVDFDVDKVDALYQKVHGMYPVIWVNSRKPLDRVRWSIAHELGHLILHEEKPTDAKEAEEQANLFASAFLMPRTDFRGECPSRLGIPELVELKRRWRCSMQSLIRRAHDIKRITPEDYRRLNIQFSKRGWRTREPYPIMGESPSLLATVIENALRELDMSEDELAQRLAITPTKLSSWRQHFPGQKPHVEPNEPRLRLTS